MKVILTPNPNSPYNLRRIHPAYGSSSLPAMTEDELIAYVVESSKRKGLIPDGADYWIVDEADLPCGSVSDENDIDFFFDAWEWSD